VIDEAELRRLTPEERRHLARTLGAIDRPHPLMDPRLRRRRRFGLMFMTACCVALACWIAILILTLPSRYTASHWQVAWVGLDIAELAGFAGTAWAAWHQRQVLIVLMNVTGTLLVCDAWFDTLTSQPGSEVAWAAVEHADAGRAGRGDVDGAVRLARDVAGHGERERALGVVARGVVEINVGVQVYGGGERGRAQHRRAHGDGKIRAQDHGGH